MESKSNGSKPRTRSAPSSALDVEAREAGPTDSPSPKRVFVVSPIGSPGTDVYKRAAYALKFIFKRALPAPEWEVHRADEGKLSDSIGQHVIRSIMEADLIIADLTGHNPNVFYELAVAHASRKPVVHLISKGERLPFDVFDQRTIHYDISDLESVEEAVEEVRAYAEAVLGKSDEVVNPFAAAMHRVRGPVMQ
jgi:nucleoside 2-deoxyribosyltransferase